MNNYKTIIVSFFLLIVVSAKAQFTTIGWGGNYVDVKSYLGKRAVEHVVIVIRNYNWSEALTIRNWKISAEIIGSLYSPAQGGTSAGAGIDCPSLKHFPPDKIRLSLRRIVSENAGNPTKASLGIPNFTSLGISPVFIVPNALQPMVKKANSNFVITTYWDLEIAGGDYLGEMLKCSDYNARRYEGDIKYTLFDDHNNQVGMPVIIHEMIDVGPLAGMSDVPSYDESGTPIFEGLSLTFTTAPDVTFHFSNPESYNSGQETTLNSALSIKAKGTAWAVYCKSLSPALMSNTGNTLPLDIVTISTSGEGSVGASPQTLSSQERLLFMGVVPDEGVVTRNLGNITYRVSPSINAVKDTYSATIQYFIVPY